ncbi:MAG: glycerol-3-phosphate 1-O-acyltransferase PlsY [Holosporaceae bacterium]|jgi:glycerol-3-phosphate acyltransferase PlsY|nr:glycerol-3-phosphate 1-O-acyltransferase PlsY [Holosporaceae bacterium]
MSKDIIYILFAYLVGSIPFGLLLAIFFGNGKLREIGSKNIGATNVLRTQGKCLGILTFLLDFLKGYAVFHYICPDNELASPALLMAPVLGHMFPPWLKFNGGKGVASYFGVLCALDVRVFLIALFIWIIIFFIWKISSVSSLISICMSSLFFYYLNHSHLLFINHLCALIILSIIIVVRHHENIKRLLQDKELNT